MQQATLSDSCRDYDRRDYDRRDCGRRDCGRRDCDRRDCDRRDCDRRDYGLHDCDRRAHDRHDLCRAHLRLYARDRLHCAHFRPLYAHVRFLLALHGVRHGHFLALLVDSVELRILVPLDHWLYL